VSQEQRAGDRPTEDDLRYLGAALALARSCPPSATAFSVGALVVDGSGRVLARGYSRETGPTDHAEEVALARLPPDVGPAGDVTLYSSLEPCSTRASRPRSCTRLVLDAGIRRVVFAWREPVLFVDCHGAEILREAGVTVVEVPELAEGVRTANAHLLG
jgi:diaminohydroxyphosphoribosylaminopyrimidine deaminase/5-amino-6-(5-phosphoribosylamino)uracil reductase